jgi:hypothetical protein
MTCILLLQGCMQSEIQGTYDVEIEIERVATPIAGTLIVSTAMLDLPPLTQEDRNTLGEWLGGDTADSNSCFIMHADSDGEDIPQNVRVFDARIRGSEVEMPIEIYRTPVQRIEIVSLEFFANTLAGDIILHDRDERRSGRIHGIRSGPPTPQRCQDDLVTFRAVLRSSLTQ